MLRGMTNVKIVQWDNQTLQCHSQRIIVKFSGRNQLSEFQCAQLEKKCPQIEFNQMLEIFNTALFRIKNENDDPSHICQTIMSSRQSEPIIQYAEPDFLGIYCSSESGEKRSSNPTRKDQWALDTIKFDPRKQIGNEQIIIAILDTGIAMKNGEIDHCLLKNSNFILKNYHSTQFLEGYHKDMNGHGTAICGIIGAHSKTMKDSIIGLNPLSPKFVYKIANEYGQCFVSEVGSAIMAFIHELTTMQSKADSKYQGIINFSAGFPASSMFLEEVCREIDKAGCLLVASAGNGNRVGLLYPAAYAARYEQSIIAVGATDKNDDVVAFSNCGESISLVAPGFEVVTTYPKYKVKSGNPAKTVAGYTYMEGTSIATTYVTGAASLVWSQHSRLANHEIKQAIIKGADHDDLLFSFFSGFGRLNIEKAIQCINQPDNLKQTKVVIGTKNRRNQVFARNRSMQCLQKIYLALAIDLIYTDSDKTSKIYKLSEILKKSKNDKDKSVEKKRLKATLISFFPELPIDDLIVTNGTVDGFQTLLSKKFREISPFKCKEINSYPDKETMASLKVIYRLFFEDLLINNPIPNPDSVIKPNNFKLYHFHKFIKQHYNLSPLALECYLRGLFPEHEEIWELHFTDKTVKTFFELFSDERLIAAAPYNSESMDNIQNW